MITFEELKKLSDEELEEQIILLRRSYINLVNDKNIQKKAEKPHLFSLTRKRIAQAYTVLRARSN